MKIIFLTLIACLACWKASGADSTESDVNYSMMSFNVGDDGTYLKFKCRGE